MTNDVTKTAIASAVQSEIVKPEPTKVLITIPCIKKTYDTIIEAVTILHKYGNIKNPFLLVLFTLVDNEHNKKMIKAQENVTYDALEITTFTKLYAAISAKNDTEFYQNLSDDDQFFSDLTWNKRIFIDTDTDELTTKKVRIAMLMSNVLKRYIFNQDNFTEDEIFSDHSIYFQEYYNEPFEDYESEYLREREHRKSYRYEDAEEYFAAGEIEDIEEYVRRLEEADDLEDQDDYALDPFLYMKESIPEYMWDTIMTKARRLYVADENLPDVDALNTTVTKYIEAHADEETYNHFDYFSDELFALKSELFLVNLIKIFSNHIPTSTDYFSFKMNENIEAFVTWIGIDD